MIKQWDEVLTIINGKSQKKVIDPNGKFPIYGSGGIMGYANDYLCDAGTTIIGRKGSINSPIYVYEKFWNVDTAFGLVPGSQLDSKYFYYFCTTYNFLKHNKATTLPSLTKADLLKIRMEVPPLPTQKKIAAILDAADAYRQKTKALIAKYDELTQSLFLDMFGDPVTNPKGWEVTTIGECFNVKGGKRLPKGTDYEIKPTEHAYIRVKDFTANGLNTSDIKYINNEVHKKISRYIISSDDVYISIAGTIGVAGFVPEILSGANLTENAAKLIAKEGVRFKKEYLSFYLNSDFAQQHIKSKTMTVGVPKLALFRIQELPYINAPENEQIKFVQRIQKIEAQKAQAQQSLEKAEELFNALLQRAFKGELVKE